MQFAIPTAVTKRHMRRLWSLGRRKTQGATQTPLTGHRVPIPAPGLVVWEG